MEKWIEQHPYLTFILIVLLCFTVDGIVVDICKTVAGIVAMITGTSVKL